MRPTISITAAALLAVAGCTVMPGPHDPARTHHTVSLVNSLSWTHAVSDKPDALRTAWPLAGLARHTEQFPLAQVKQCDAAGVCSWGVLKARRTLSAPRYVAGGVAVDVELAVDVDRSHDALQGGENVAMAIPADVPALSAKRTVRKSLVLQYGKVERIGLDFGIGYDLCAQRLDKAGNAVDACDIPFQ
ncbi:hypothetical protein ACFSQU_03445 [Massilia sp. GCM10020059]|uniref:Lipoprotein n=1 Tax=Massilia agrisoli TaxID=2892444 RepID=A0ABS8IQE5_9BURK|nr:hypothetical protein [Massilia agrisoli]MCC6069973.1 hypothetical protein [Massilia agrisoli]